MKLSQLSDLFEQAIAIEDADQRSEFIESACLEQDDREKLTGLVDAHQQECDIVDQTDSIRGISQSLTVDHVMPTEGTVIGNYRLLQEIGEGGMGNVYMADQLQPIQRRVAIKIIKAEMNSRHILARFEAEREALSRLDHPNITRIIDAGISDSGLPYFVMELVRGDSLIQYCDRHKLSINQRIELLEKVCLAVHHAHQKGILHRDIKPANIMVTMHDGVPVPKVIDFGIAKALDRPLTQKTLFTRYGDMVGTPQYMSPEQAEQSGLDIDLRTDIYSLGVVLYELLTGTTPIETESLEGKGVLGVLETVRDCDTESPSLRLTRTLSANETPATQRNTNGNLLKRLLRGELDWITMKALSKARNLRYESAAAMAADLRCYLRGEPVTAAAPTFAYLARKMYQRHRKICLTVAAAAILLVLSSLVSLSWAISNSRLNSLAMQRASQLREKTDELEKLNLELEQARDEARAAEQEALTLANEKKKQAAYERAVTQAILKDVTNSLTTANGDDSSGDRTKTSLDLPKQIKSMIENLETSGAEITSAQVENGTARSSAPAKIQVIGIPGQFIGKPFLSTGKRKKRQLASPIKQAEFREILTEEYRREFGDQHWIVAESLLESCSALVRLSPVDWSKIESRAREADAILEKAEPFRNRSVFRVLASCWLAKSLDGQDRTREAEVLKQSCRSKIADTEMTDPQRQWLLKLLDLEI